jgi:RNA polymerase sigma-70 factor (ECF subfamily)
MNAKEYNLAVENHSNAVYRFILSSIKDKDKSKDIVQDTFEKVWLNRENINFEKAKSYIFTTAYHTMIDAIRKDKKSAKMNEVDLKTYSHNEQYSDLQEILHTAINKLPDDQKSVVLLRDYEGYSYQEISDITGLSESQVKVYIYRARLFLKEYIGSAEAVA